ncbi:MAG TPA: hypothetical protein VKD90_10710 [Gemmataceae bacterium]|nr:hypothetical protein [Gemmataceae bacterium]
MTASRRAPSDWVFVLSIGTPLVGWAAYLSDALFGVPIDRDLEFVRAGDPFVIGFLMSATAVGGVIGLHRARVLARGNRRGLAVEAEVTRVIGSPRGSPIVWVRYDVGGRRVDTRLTLPGTRVGDRIRMLVDPADVCRCLPA